MPNELEVALRQRQQFWVDTCREPLEMQAAPRQVRELHKEHGWCFHAPGATQVQQVLDALDAALPDWEREHPGLFYRTLELNFPELLRGRARNAV